MGIHSLPYRQQNLVTDLRHNKHTQLDDRHEQQVQKWGLSGRKGGIDYGGQFL